MISVPQLPAGLPLSSLLNQTATTNTTRTPTTLTSQAASTDAASLASAGEEFVILESKNRFCSRLSAKFKLPLSSLLTGQGQNPSAPPADSFNNVTQQVIGQITGDQQQSTGTQTDTDFNNGLTTDNDLSTTVSTNAFNSNRQLWNQQGTNGNYSFTLTQRSSSATSTPSAPIQVTVTNGQISRASYSNNTAVTANTLAALPTIETLFTMIQAAAQRGERTDVLYDRAMGFPNFVFFGNNRANGSDDVSYIIDNVRRTTTA